VHCGSIRQTATIIDMPVAQLRTGDRATVRFRFIKSPEYLRLGMKLIFREGRTKAIGSICKLHAHVPAQTSNTRSRGRGHVADAHASSKRMDTTDEASHRNVQKRSKPNRTATDSNTANPEKDLGKTIETS
jgi:hypothetical protein